MGESVRWRRNSRFYDFHEFLFCLLFHYLNHYFFDFVMSKDPIIERLHKTKAILENLNKEINNPIDIHISDYSLHDYKNLRQVIIEAGMIFCFSEKNKR